MEDVRPKISGLEAFFLVAFCLFFDGLDALATFLDGFLGVGEFIKLLINITVSPILWFWLIMKGVRSTWLLAGIALEMVPLIGNTLPIRTVTMVVTIYLDWHPQTAATIVSVVKITKQNK
jgi:hypothetical protein